MRIPYTALTKVKRIMFDETLPFEKKNHKTSQSIFCISAPEQVQLFASHREKSSVLIRKDNQY